MPRHGKHKQHKQRPLALRFWSKVEAVSSGCWEWRGAEIRGGYGKIGIGRRGEGQIGTHRAAWLLAHFVIPDDMHVLHRCDNRRCVRPDHLFLGTHQDNMEDMVSKGRQWNGGGCHGEEHGRAKLSNEAVAAIRLRLRGGEKRKVLANEFSVNVSTVYRAATGRSWSSVGEEA